MSARQENGGESCRMKICGLRRREDILAVNRLLPDYIGFVFAGSRRRVSPQQAAALRRELAPQIRAVGVFVNAPADEILALERAGVIDLIQLHGDEDEEYIRRLKEESALPVIRAVRVCSREQIQEADRLPCDYLLLDTFTKGSYGGSGKQFDWGMIPSLKTPWFLAGGISLENLSAAMACRPFCIDVSSAVETDGWKDPAKMAAMVAAVRAGLPVK